MVWHAVDGEEFLTLSGNDASYVFVEFLFVRGGNKILTSLDGEDHLDVNLGVGVCHAVCRS